MSAFAILSDKFSIGDPEIQAASVLQAWRRNGVLPVDGIDIDHDRRREAIDGDGRGGVLRRTA